MKQFQYKQYKNLNVVSDERYGFKLSKQVVGNEGAFIGYFGNYLDRNNPKHEDLIGPVGHFVKMGSHVDDNFHIATNHKRTTGDAFILYSDDSYNVSFYFGNNQSSFGYLQINNGNANFLYEAKTHLQSNGFKIRQLKDGSFHIMKMVDDKMEPYGYHIATNGEIIFTKFKQNIYEEIVEKTSSKQFAVRSNLPKPFKMVFPSANVNETKTPIPLKIIKSNGANIGEGVLIPTNVDKKEFERKNLNEFYHKEGYAFDFDDNSGVYGYVTFKKDGNYVYKGAVLNCYPKVNSVRYIDNNTSTDGYVIYNMKGSNCFIINYEKGGNASGLGFQISEFEGLFLCDNDKEGKNEVFFIDFNTFSLTDENNKKTYNHPYYVSSVEEDEEEREDLEEQIIDDLIEETNETVEEVKEEIKVEEPVVKKEKKPSLYELIQSTLLTFVKYLLFPFNWLIKKIKKIFTRNKRKYYRSSSIRDFFENIWDHIVSFFTMIGRAIASFFKMIGKGILVGLSGILTGILFVPKIILKGLSAIGGGAKEVSFGSVASFGAPLLSGICLLLVIFNCIIPINNWFSDLVSVHIFSWMGLHLCTMFLNAVGVNFFSVIGVILIFFVDLIYNLLLIILEIIMCILYLLVFFIGIYGVGVVALVLIILSYVFFARSKGALAGVTFSMILSIGLLIPYYILLIQLWNSVG